MKLVCLSFTRAGEKLGKLLEDSREFYIDHISNKSVKDGIKALMPDIWKEYEGIIFISATGIAARYIAPYIEDKTKDPAVLVIDDLGRYVISLLSGHLGGANKLAKELAASIGGRAIITTASDSRGFQSLDLFARDRNYYIEDMRSLARLASLMVNGEKIGFYSEGSYLPDYKNLEVIEDLGQIVDKKSRIGLGIKGLIIISSSNISEELSYKLRAESIAYTILRPRNINIGIGCRRGVSKERIIGAIYQALETNKLSSKSLKSMGTIEIKKSEEGILEAARYFGLPLEIFSIDEIKEVEDNFQKSQFVKDAIGVYSVSEPSAYLLGGEFIVKKASYKGITISITKENGNG